MGGASCPQFPDVPLVVPGVSISPLGQEAERKTLGWLGRNLATMLWGQATRPGVAIKELCGLAKLVGGVGGGRKAVLFRGVKHMYTAALTNQPSQVGQEV